MSGTLKIRPERREISKTHKVPALRQKGLKEIKKPDETKRPPKNHK